jgi:2-hydroxy-3-keto-5-methylthiopentenyl-1-phosphate phosphatase
MLKSVRLSFEESTEILKRGGFEIPYYISTSERTYGRPSSTDIKLDPGFSEFYTWCKTQSIPVVIVSGCVDSTLDDVLGLIRE